MCVCIYVQRRVETLKRNSAIVSHKLCMNDKKKKCNIGKNRRRFEAIFLSRTIKEEEKLFEKRIITKEQRRVNYILSTLNNSRHGGRERDSRFEHNSLSVSNRFQLKYKAVVTINTHVSILKPWKIWIKATGRRYELKSYTKRIIWTISINLKFEAQEFDRKKINK